MKNIIKWGINEKIPTLFEIESEKYFQKFGCDSCEVVIEYCQKQIRKLDFALPVPHPIRC